MRSVIFFLLLFVLTEGSHFVLKDRLNHQEPGKCNLEKHESAVKHGKIFLAEMNRIYVLEFNPMREYVLLRLNSSIANSSTPNIISMTYNSEKQTLLFVGDKVRSRIYEYLIPDQKLTYTDFDGLKFKEVVFNQDTGLTHFLTYDNIIGRRFFDMRERVFTAPQNASNQNLAYWNEKQQFFWIGESNGGRQLQFLKMGEDYVRSFNIDHVDSFALDTKSGILFVTKRGGAILEFHLNEDDQFVESYEGTQSMEHIGLSESESFVQNVATTPSLIYRKGKLYYIQRDSASTMFKNGTYHCEQVFSMFYVGSNLPKNAEYKRKRPTNLNPHLSLDCSNGCVIVTTNEKLAKMQFDEMIHRESKNRTTIVFMILFVLFIIVCCCR